MIIKCIAQLMDLPVLPFEPSTHVNAAIFEIFPANVSLSWNGAWNRLHILLRANQSFHAQI